MYLKQSDQLCISLFYLYLKNQLQVLEMISIRI